MSSPGVGGSVNAATDVMMSNPVQDDLMLREGSYWSNVPIAGKLVLANLGGQETVQTTTGVTGSRTINLANGNIFVWTLSGNVTLSNVSGAVSGRAASFALYVRQGGGGSRTISWPSSFRWSGGAPVLSTANGALDILVFESVDGGSNWYGSLVGKNFV